MIEPKGPDEGAQIQELRSAIAARDAFIAAIAHELRNPMTPIAGQITLLLRLVRDGQASSTRLEAGLARLEWLVDRYLRRATTLLDVTRLDAGKAELERTPVSLSDVVAEVAAAMMPIAEHARCELVLDLEEQLSVIGDRLAIEQIVDNLLSNALKFGAGQPIQISTLSQGPYALVRIRDHGCGISVQDRRRIFDRFERVVGGAPRGPGFGVGLWVVRQLAHAMGATIDVDSVPGQGSVFTISWPRRAEDKE